MKLIIGGAFQGKKTFAYTLCPEVSFIDGAKCAAEDLFPAEVSIIFMSISETV